MPNPIGVDHLGDPCVTRTVEVMIPGPVYDYLAERAASNQTTVSSEARTALMRGAIIEWCSEEMADGAPMSSLASSIGLPLEVVMEALGPVTGKGSPFKAYG